MDWIILHYLKDRNLRVFLYMLLLEIVLLFFQYSIVGEYRRESLKVIDARREISRETRGNSFRRERLSRYETGLTELESALPRNVESEAAAVAFVAARLRDHGIVAVAEESIHNGKEIGIVACGESVYTDMLSFFAGLQQDAPAVGVRELLVQALDGEKVHFSAKIIFFRATQRGKESMEAYDEKREK